MAISATHYHILKILKERGQLPQGGRILEIGKANWYGDADPSIVHVALKKGTYDPYAIVEWIYTQLFDWPNLESFDADPAAVARGAKPINLNHRRDIAPDFSTVINHGTAEHVFHIANVFELMHDACQVGGLMIHESPFTGWVDHGFYCLQPTLFYDLARENGYEMVMVAMEHLRSRSYIEFTAREQILEMRRQEQLPDDAMLFVAMRKTKDGLFKIPMQGVYAGTVSAEATKAWRELR